MGVSEVKCDEKNPAGPLTADGTGEEFASRISLRLSTLLEDKLSANVSSIVHLHLSSDGIQKLHRLLEN